MRRTELMADLRGSPTPELTSRLERLAREGFNLRFQRATKQLDNPMRLQQVRREIARIRTLLRERELVEE